MATPKSRIFFICSTVIEVDKSVARQMVKDGVGKFREAAPVMEAALAGSGVEVLAYPTYEEWKEDNEDVEHRVVGDFNVARSVAAKLGQTWN